MPLRMEHIEKSPHPTYSTARTKDSSNIIIRRYEYSSDKESELGGFDSSKAPNGTKDVVFPESSTMDENEQSISERGRPRSRVGIKKKMKLSVSNTGVCHSIRTNKENIKITESLENFCVWHKKARQSNDPRTQTTEVRKISKPHSQPAAERGIRSPQRTMTAGKLSSIANTKYPDSIFKVYIPEGNRIIKQKKVVPPEMRPQTPPRSGKTMAPRKFPKLLPNSSPNGSIENSPQSSKLTMTPQKIFSKTAIDPFGPIDLEIQSSERYPKRMTIMKDISPTEVQEEKTLPCPLEEGENPESPLDTDTDQADSDCSVEHSSFYDGKKVRCPPSSAVSTSSRSNYTLSSKRSVTWATDSEDAKTISKTHLCENKSNNSPETDITNAPYQRSGRSLDTLQNKNSSNSNKLEKIRSTSKDQLSESRHFNVRRPAFKHFKSKEHSKRCEPSRIKKSAVHFESNPGSDTNNTPKHVHHRMPRRKEDSKEYLRVKCRYCRRHTPVDSSQVIDFSCKTKSKNNQLKKTRVKLIENVNEEKKQEKTPNFDSFHDKRHAIINKHTSGNEVLKHEKGLKSESLSDQSSKSAEEEQNLTKGLSAPIAIKSNMDNYSRSNAEINLSNDEDRSMHGMANKQDSPRLTLRKENIEDKPLRKLFQTGNNIVLNNENKTPEENSETCTNNSTSKDISKQTDEEQKFQRSIGSSCDIINVSEKTITSLNPRKLPSVEISTIDSNTLDYLSSPERDSKILKKPSSLCTPTTIMGDIEPSYLMVEAYNVHREVGHLGSDNSGLDREPPMLHIPLGETAIGSTQQVNKHESFNDNKSFTNDEASATLELNDAYPGTEIIGQNAVENQNILSEVNRSKESIRSPRRGILPEVPSEVLTSSPAVQQRPSSPKVVSENKTTNSQLLENRKIQLKKMMSKEMSIGSSKLANDIKSKWNLTQKSIQERKKKMLSSLRYKTDEGTPASGCSSPPKSTSDNECPLFLLSCDEDVNEIIDDGLEEADSYFRDLIQLPRARSPQPYSSIEILKASPIESVSVKSLSSFPLDDTPEKPLCESKLIAKEKKQQEKNDGAQIQKRYVEAVNEESLEREEKKVHSNFNSRAPGVDAGNNGNIVIPSPAAVDTNSGKSKALATKRPCSSTSPQTKPTPSPTGSRPLPRSPVVSRQMNSTRNTYQSRDSSSSRSNYSSPSTRSTRRNIQNLERPPSRKPHMVDITDEDSDEHFFLHPQPSPTTVQVDDLRLTKQNSVESQKKTPPCRMYSTLKDSPPLSHESLKYAIRDGLKADKNSCNSGNTIVTNNELPTSQEKSTLPTSMTENATINPLSRLPRKPASIPRMSPGSLKIIQSKSKSIIPNKCEQTRKIVGTNITETTNTSVTGTRRPALEENNCKRSTDQKINDRSNTSSPVRTGRESRGKSSTAESTYKRPPFRTGHNIDRTNEPFPSKLKNFSTSHQPPPNYQPPWERVNLTPPESPFKGRAMHDKRQGINSRAATGPQLKGGYSSSAKNPTSKSIGGGLSSGNVTPIGGRTPNSCSTPLGDMSPAGCRTPIRSTTPTVAASRSPIGDRRSTSEKLKEPSKTGKTLLHQRTWRV